MTQTKPYLSYAIVGGAIYSVFDAGLVISKNGLSTSIPEQLVLIGLVLVFGILASLFGLFLFPLHKWPSKQRNSPLFFVPIFAFATLSMSEILVRDPPPFVQAAYSSVIGLPILLIASGLLFAAVTRWTDRPKHKSAVILLMVFVMAGIMTSQRSPKIQKENLFSMPPMWC